MVATAAPTAVATSAFPHRPRPGVTRFASAPAANGATSESTPIERLATVSGLS